MNTHAATGPSCNTFAVTGDVPTSIGGTELTFSCKDVPKGNIHPLQVRIVTPGGYAGIASTDYSNGRTNQSSWRLDGHVAVSTVTPFKDGRYAIGWTNINQAGGYVNASSVASSCGLRVDVTVSLDETPYGGLQKLVKIATAKNVVAGCHEPGASVHGENVTPSFDLAVAVHAPDDAPSGRFQVADGTVTVTNVGSVASIPAKVALQAVLDAARPAYAGPGVRSTIVGCESLDSYSVCRVPDLSPHESKTFHFHVRLNNGSAAVREYRHAHPHVFLRFDGSVGTGTFVYGGITCHDDDETTCDNNKATDETILGSAG